MRRSGLVNGSSVGLENSISLAQLKTTNLKIRKKKRKSPMRMLPERIYRFIVFHEKQASFQSHLEMTPGRRAALHPLQEHPTCTCSSQQT